MYEHKDGFNWKFCAWRRPGQEGFELLGSNSATMGCSQSTANEVKVSAPTADASQPAATAPPVNAATRKVISLKMAFDGSKVKMEIKATR